MRLRSVLLVSALLATLVAGEDPTTAEEAEDRDKRQTQPFYTGGLSLRPTPKPQPFTGGLHHQTVQPRFAQVQGLLSQAPQGFRTVTPVDDDSDEIDRNTVSPSPQPLVQRPQYQTQQAQQQYRPAPSPTPQVVLRSRPQQQQQEYRRPQQQQQQQGRFKYPQQQLTEEQLEELEEEKEEPDRLTLLLPQSKFDCHGLNTGYYADEGLDCEVFHYCQDNARHSWICPEGFVFHQVHLICMPPSSDNICKQSTQFHFVNDYLYRPINQEEHDNKPNVTLRYSDRYYPENYYPEEGVESRPVPVKASRPVQQYQQSSLRPTPTPQQFRSTNQVFHSPEEVNIPLQHRRPVSPQPQRTFPTPGSEEYEY